MWLSQIQVRILPELIQTEPFSAIKTTGEGIKRARKGERHELYAYRSGVGWWKGLEYDVFK